MPTDAPTHTWTPRRHHCRRQRQMTAAIQHPLFAWTSSVFSKLIPAILIAFPEAAVSPVVFRQQVGTLRSIWKCTTEEHVRFSVSLWGSLCHSFCAAILFRIPGERSELSCSGITNRGHLLAHNMTGRTHVEQTRPHMTPRMRAQIGVRATMFNRTCGGLKRSVVCQTSMLDTCARGRWDGSLHELRRLFKWRPLA